MNLFQCITMDAVQRDEIAPAYALPLGPDSLTWRFFGDGRMILLGPRAAVLQNMLPALGQGVEDHSVWFAETLARLRRSIPPIYNTVFGADPEASGHEVRDFHRPIRGRLPDGSAYSALNPDTYYWAHACFVEHLITATDTFIRRLTARGEGADLRRVGDLVRALRRELHAGRRGPMRSSRATSSTRWRSGWWRTALRRTAWATRPRAGRDRSRSRGRSGGWSGDPSTR